VFDLLGPPTVARGEDGEQYCRFVTAMIRSVSPVNVGDVLYVRDVIDLEWDVLRYRSAKAVLINDQSGKLWTMNLDSNDNDDATRSARAITWDVPKLRQLDLMIESAEIRRDRACRELERRRAHLATRMRQAANVQAEVQIANDENAQRAA
jgi:hypothetical protein